MRLKKILLSAILITTANATQDGDTICLPSSKVFPCLRPQISFSSIEPVIEEDRSKMKNIFELCSVEKYSSDMCEYTEEIDLENFHLDEIKLYSPITVNLTDRDVGGREIENLLPFKDYIYGISLSSNFLDSDSIKPIGKLSQLRWIDLSNNSFFDDGIDHLLNLKNLFHLKITHNNNISIKSIKKLSNISSLEFIEIDHIEFLPLPLYESNSIDLSLFKKLKKINIQGSSIKKSNFFNVGSIQIVE